MTSNIYPTQRGVNGANVEISSNYECMRRNLTWLD